MLLIAGCEGSPEPTADSTSVSAPPSASPSAVTTTAPPTPEPSPASSAGPATNIPVPVKPALADENSEEGLEAFTEYWLELFSYGYETNEWETFEALTDSGCKTCQNLSQEIKSHYETGGWIAGGGIDLISTDTEFILNTSGSINSFVDIEQGQIRYFKSDGTDLKITEPSPQIIGVTISLWDQGHWVMLDFGSPEGT
jgi:hypothetical protein